MALAAPGKAMAYAALGSVCEEWLDGVAVLLSTFFDMMWMFAPMPYPARMLDVLSSVGYLSRSTPTA